jgi:hypothetical protein
MQITALCEQLGYPVEGDDIGARLAAMAEDKTTAVYVADLTGVGVAGWVKVTVSWVLELGWHAEVVGSW